MNKKQIFFTALFFLTSILACVVPGLQTASVPAPAPTADTDLLATIVAETVSAARMQTEQALPKETTATPLPTETVTATPRVSQSGTSLLLLDDQTYLFTDYQAGIELTIPAGWMPIRVNEQEYLSAFASDAAKDAAILAQLNSIQNLDPAWFRLNVIDIQSGHVINGGITDINVIFQENDPRSLKEVAEIEKSTPKLLNNFEFISSKFQPAVNGMNTLVIEQKWDSVSGPTYYRGVFFIVPSGLVALDFYSPFDFKDTVLPDFEKIVNSFVLLNQ